MSLFGHKIGLITLHDTGSDRKRLKKSALVRHGFGAPKPQVEILSITSWGKPGRADTSFVLLFSFPMERDFR
jgi:hypothetical protein